MNEAGRTGRFVQCLMLCFAGAGLTAFGQVLAPDAARTMTLSGFRTRGIQDDGAVRWEMRGAKAVVKGAVAEVTDAVVVFNADEELWRVTSPACTFNQATGIGVSEAPLRVESRAMTLEGVGYDIIVETQIVRVRRAVRMVVGREQAAALGPGRNAPAASEPKTSDAAPDTARRADHNQTEMAP